MGLTLNNNPWMNGTVIIDSTVGKDTFLSHGPDRLLLFLSGIPMEHQ